MSRRTSFSRGVSRSSCASISRRLLSSCAMERGVKRVPPWATVRIASTTSCAARDLWMNALVVPFFIPAASLHRHPELDRRAESRLAFYLVPSPREEGAFVKREQAEMSWQAIAFGDHKATAVVLHDPAHPAVLDLQRDP